MRWRMLCLTLALSACRPDAHDTTLVTVQRQVIEANPIYSGRIQALRTVDIIAPYDGTIERLPVHLGQQVNADDELLTLHSEPYAKATQQALLNFLKAKEDYLAQWQKYRGAQQLWQHGLIASNDYHSQRSDLANSYALLLQQQSELTPYLSTVNTHWNLEDPHQVAQLFASQHTALKIDAPMAGVVLSARKTTSHNEAQSPLLASIGSTVKQGDGLMAIGDISGYTVTIRVSQMQINSLFIGQSATVKGDAFAEQLSGHIRQIGLQANIDPNASEDSTPIYLVDVQILSVPPQAQHHIRLGMSAKVTLLTPTQATLSIPLTAVGFRQGQAVVMRMVSGHPHITTITTGHTSQSRVQVLAGLSEGDQILATYPT